MILNQGNLLVICRGAGNYVGTLKEKYDAGILLDGGADDQEAIAVGFSGKAVRPFNAAHELMRDTRGDRDGFVARTAAELTLVDDRNAPGIFTVAHDIGGGFA